MSLIGNAAGAEDHKDADGFQTWVINACKSRESKEFGELYDFLMDCFVKADKTRSGVIGPDEFDAMIEVAANAPRKFGFAPSTADTYKSEAERKEKRMAMFTAMDYEGNGAIHFNDWLNFTYSHICGKAKTLDPSLSGVAPIAPTDANSRMMNSKEDFTAFLKSATSSVSGLGSEPNTEYKQLYAWLMKCFVEADTDKDGRVTMAEFDVIIEKAAAAPRKFGFAPPTKDTYASDEERIAKRKIMFDAIDLEKNGFIKLDEWLKYTMEHIKGKVATLK